MSNPRKAKGSSFEREVLDMIKAKLKIDDDEIRKGYGRERGVDIKRMSKECKRKLPISIECKFQERLNIWKAWDQAKYNADKEKSQPGLVFKRSRHEPMIMLYFEYFLDLLNELDEKERRDDLDIRFNRRNY